MEEIIRVQDQHYILATSRRVDARTHLLKHDDTFAVMSLNGEIVPVGLGEQGLYHEGTRFLSRLQFRLGEDRPFFLSSAIRERSSFLVVNLTNADVSVGDQILLPRNTLHILRSLFLWRGTLYERLRIRNYGVRDVLVSPTYHFDADFADIFEVRGHRRDRRGILLPMETDTSEAGISYRGLDGVTRWTRFRFSPVPTDLRSGRIAFEARLEPQEERTFCLSLRCESGPSSGSWHSFEEAALEVSSESRKRHRNDARIGTSNVHFNDLIHRGISDLRIMIANTPDGIYPHAGVPWFSTVFGRDGIITALQFLWVKPGLARGVLSRLAATQAAEDDPERDAEPGKIVHEMRHGEMAALGEIPFGRYYGSADATPLFLMLAGAYYRATGDLEFVRSLWPNLTAALRWIEEFGDADRDGFVEYQRRSSKGLSCQGWKDSHDAVFHDDGSLAEGPIALAEVQAYVYGAWRAAALLADALGEASLAESLRRKAAELQVRFEATFWCEDLSTYALALDGRKRLCRVRTSNAGHALFTGIASAEHARRVAGTLMSEESFSGWGIRTVASTEARYNPMSYHNGSVWPHDNALIARGFARYGIARQDILQILLALLDASTYSHLHRLPELHCGFRRRMGEGPTLYPVACSPQSWSLGAVFMLLESCLGLTVDALAGEVRLVRPILPESLERMTIQNLRVGAASVDLMLQRRARDVEVDVVRRRGEVSVVVVK